MLKSLHIENYALIRQSHIDFDEGMVAITGQTGAGKSIMLGALALLLGQRADSKVLFDSQRKCIVEALFKCDKEGLKSLFAEGDVDYNDDGSIIIRREILPNAKSRAFVNDTPVSVAFLRQLGDSIIDIHSQHATLLLANSHFQTSLVDSMADDSSSLTDYQESYKEYTRLKKELEQLTAEEQQNRKDYDYNKFLYYELAAASLSDGEQESLEQESTLLAHAESIKQSMTQIVDICDEGDDSALSRINACRNLLGKLTGINTQLDSLSERLESTLIEMRDIVSTIESLNDEISFSPARQQEIDDRLSLIYRLQKKHGVDSIAALLEIQEQLDSKLTAMGDTDNRIQQVSAAADAAFSKMERKAKNLSACRKKGAANLEKQITPLFSDLGMENATLKATVTDDTTYGPMGNNHISLLFNANKGGQLRELSKVASGGEMSRLMLAVKALTARAGLLPTVIFDEIDAGISGDISVKVGRIMKQMASNMQVIVITHLPQIAARATRHFKVIKDDNDDVTASRICLLDNDGRRHELAVMLSADPPSQAALQTATELMQLQ